MIQYASSLVTSPLCFIIARKRCLYCLFFIQFGLLIVIMLLHNVYDPCLAQTYMLLKRIKEIAMNRSGLFRIFLRIRLTLTHNAFSVSPNSRATTLDGSLFTQYMTNSFAFSSPSNSTRLWNFSCSRIICRPSRWLCAASISLIATSWLSFSLKLNSFHFSSRFCFRNCSLSFSLKVTISQPSIFSCALSVLRYAIHPRQVIY